MRKCGRPFSAEFALENHLIDEIGTYYDTLEYLLQQEGLSEDDVVVEAAGKKKNLLLRIFSAGMNDSIISTLMAHLSNTGVSVK